MNESEVEFPEMVQGILDNETVEAYFQDLQMAEIIEVLVKGAPETFTKEGKFTLESARALFDSGQVRGVQIRYRYQSEEWWDTLIRADGEVRLVRVRHDWSAYDQS